MSDQAVEILITNAIHTAFIRYPAGEGGPNLDKGDPAGSGSQRISDRKEGQSLVVRTGCVDYGEPRFRTPVRSLHGRAHDMVARRSRANLGRESVRVRPPSAPDPPFFRRM